jgi:23S rRNA pseudouridine1911/1915/1917 synthase
LHRLDKDTSGVLLVAKTDAAHHALSTQFHERTIKKTYLALTRKAPKQPSGTITGAIGRHPVQRQRMAILAEGGRAATTAYRVRERFSHGALVECDLLTGRTHQIRVHLKSLGCPIFGDSLYGKAEPALAPRQMLHAWRIQFYHPTTGLPLSCEAALPPDFLAAQAHLRAGA